MARIQASLEERHCATFKGDLNKLCGPHSLHVVFNDGISKRVNVWPLLDGPIFERMTLDPIAGTVVWPNEADFAPEALHELEAEMEHEQTEQATPPLQAAVG